MKPARLAIVRHLWAGLGLDRLFRHHRVPRGREVMLDRRRIYVLPTRYGLLFAAMLFVMLLGSINYNNSLGFMLTFLLASLALVSILYTYRNIAYLKLGAGRTVAAFAGGTARFVVHVRDLDGLARYSVRLAPQAGEAVYIDVAARGDDTVELALPARQRGRLALPRITVSTTYPLGLIRAWSYAELDMECLVYPQPSGRRPLPTPRQSEPGKHSGSAAGSDDFLGFRAYQNGDALRHVHWKALARALPPLTKQFAAGEAPELWLDGAALPQVDNEARLRQLCRWVLEAERLGRRYGVKLPGVTIAPAQGDAHRQRCLETLALYREQQ